MAINTNIEIFRGNDIQLPITIIDDADDPVDISAWSDLAITIRRAYGERILVEKSTAGPEMEITDPVNGLVTVILTDDDTNKLTAASHVYDVKRMDEGGEVTLLYGKITVHSVATE